MTEIRIAANTIENSLNFFGHLQIARNVSETDQTDQTDQAELEVQVPSKTQITGVFLGVSDRWALKLRGIIL